MDGLILIIGLIAWFVSSLKKKNKKDQERISQIQTRAAQRMKKQVEKTPLENVPSHALRFDEGIHQSYKPAEGESTLPNGFGENIFRGSLESASLEGECVCSPELEHVREEEVAEDSVYAEEIGQSSFVDISARGIMQAVVMNEVLARPKQRMRRY